MAALIEYVCTAQHDRREDASVTLVQKAWAYCPLGASTAHEWKRIDPTPVEKMRSRPGNGGAHLAVDKGDERSLAGGPAR